MSHIIHPEIQVIGNKHYRKNPMRSQNKSLNEEDHFHEDPVELESLEINNQIIVKPLKLKDDKFTCSIHIPSIFFGYIIGKGRQSLRDLENTTKCHIIIPRNISEITIESTKESSIDDCIKLIQMKVTECRLKSKPSHYLEFHLDTPEIKNNLINFKKGIYDKYGKSKLDSWKIYDSMFQLVEKFHITLSVFNAGDDFEYKLVEQDLEEYLKTEEAVNLFHKGPFHLAIRGLEIMNDDPSSTWVLYASVIDESGRIQELANSIAHYLHFKQWTDSLKGDQMKVKLHATLINSSKRTEEEKENSSKDKGFDVREILKDFGNYEFTSGCIIDKIRIAQVHSIGTHGNIYDSYIQIQPDGKTSMLKNYDN